MALFALICPLGSSHGDLRIDMRKLRIDTCVVIVFSFGSQVILRNCIIS